MRFEQLFETSLRNGLSKPKKVRGIGYPMINMGEIFSHDIIYDIPMDLVPMTEKEKENGYLKKYDLLFARQSLTLAGAGKCSIFLGNNVETTFESHLIRVRLDKKKCNPLFYYYYFQSLIGKSNISGIVEQVSAAGIRGSDLKRLEVPMPNILIQNKIVDIMYKIDSKIELNNQMIATLEELAATLFKRWFVDFEFPDENGNPYKSSGGKMVDSELGEIPEGWENGTLSDIGEIVGGGTPSKKMIEYYVEGDIPWITPKDLSEQKNTFISNGKTNITELGLKKSSAKMIPEKSVLFSSRAPIGYIAISTQPVSTNQGFKSIIPKKSKHYGFVYLLLKSQVNNIESRATGSTFKEVSGTIMKNFPIILPKENILNDFSKLTDSIFKLILNLEVNVNNLEQTRNLVLPKLLSGELEV
ncbi:restriction endonuclease subunit S [Enterococcus sp. 2201sp1_2201st1_B8_2201SCRN_220225]|uniref:restriction endonuclease subunit S n=1 Tax=unclassified Enterococcus TaxID=2608891 RepID=UPI0034A43E5D